MREAATASRDASACRHITTALAHDACVKDVCYEMAFSSSVDNCDGIPDPQLAQRCSLSLHNVSEATWTAMNDPDVADDCWAKLGASAVTACLRIKDTDRRRRCVSQGCPGAEDPALAALG